ncbi:MAG TPA: GAF and ANTAR domain-containing protein [Nocardioidaceae bacterium]|nr:GAF and ANTAR domain-containing protein [Nocardioidaceae bacterium]
MSGQEPTAVFQSLADLVYAGEDFDSLYSAACTAATQLVSGCDHASVMIKRKDEFVTAASSDSVARLIDTMERETGAGPCLDAILDESAYLDTDLATSSSWPQLTDRVLEETPVRGVAGFRLVVENRKLGALNIFSDTPGALTRDSINEAVMLAAFVSVAMIAEERRDEATTLRRGLESNREIGKAVGLMMAFHKIDDDAAFALLKKASQDMNLKLAEVARQVVTHARHPSA